MHLFIRDVTIVERIIWWFREDGDWVIGALAIFGTGWLLGWSWVRKMLLTTINRGV